MKLRSNVFRPEQADVVWQQGIGAAYPLVAGAFNRGVEMNDLAQRVHAGVSATGGGDCDRVVRDRRKCLLQAVLNRASGGLELPAAEAGTVVLNTTLAPELFWTCSTIVSILAIYVGRSMPAHQTSFTPRLKRTMLGFCDITSGILFRALLVVSASLPKLMIVTFFSGKNALKKSHSFRG